MSASLHLNASPPSATTFDSMTESLRPYKLRSRASGKAMVAMKIPTNTRREYTLLYLEDGEVSWGNTLDAGLAFLNTYYDFLGPLEAGETVLLGG